MQVLRDAGDLAKGDQKGRKGGTKGEFLTDFLQNYAIFVCLFVWKEKKKRLHLSYASILDLL